ncbi:WxL protein peptidoglycan domain-containing protein [Micromonospora deserti]|uniref:DUF916 domain-containing protein n=1 Tax=Micromonospora deserti TaxID=2070366 RepID=A0A2W2CV64_9ACTN|nr:DUF916 domain-containing protein [Micromonospora deserti]PZG01771.1 DUF916 domain-containing protein [Micromonospora deserti]
MRLPAVFAAALVLAAVTPAPRVAAAPLAPRPTAVPVPAGSGGPKVAVPDPPPAMTVGVVPSTPTGPNGRSAFVYKLNPGAAITDHVGIVNHSTRPITVSVYASDAFTTAQGGYDLLPAGRQPVDVGSWVRLPSRTVTVPSTSRLDVPFTLTVPDNATPGDHAGGIVASLAGTTTDAQGNQVSVDHRVGSRIHLRVTGELAPALAVEDLVIRHAGAINPLAGGTVTATFTVRNTGNVRLTAGPSLRVAGPFGVAARTAGAAPLPEILPGGSLRTTVRMTGVPPLVRLSATAAAQPRPVGDQVLDPPPPTATADAGLWALPWPQLLLALALGLGGWTVTLIRRRRRTHFALALDQARAQGRAEAARESQPATSVRRAAGPAVGDTPPDRDMGKDDQ